MLAILDRQHGTRYRDWAGGASADLDGDGVIDSHETEAKLTPLYIAEAYRRLVSAGHEAEAIAIGHYKDRHARALELAEAVKGANVGYIACHLNAADPPGSYGLVCWRSGSKPSKALAEQIAIALRRLPELGGNVKVVEAKKSGDWSRAYTTIAGVSPSSGVAAVCFEPCFINQPDHRSLLVGDGPRRIGKALAEGLARWGG